MPSEFVQYVLQHPPRCISGVNPEPTPHSKPTLKLPRHLSVYHGQYGERDIAGVDTASFVIGCSCGCRAAYLLGYYVISYGRHRDTVFVGPLSLECSKCGAICEFFDTRKHGYDGEQGVNTCIIGKGRPDRFACPRCGEKPVIVRANFSYQGVEEFQGEMRERRQDFFNTFDVVAQCTNCNAQVEVTSFECD
jgi:predicted RNA-binding Zn-ribbon protein involved in translation (DUF1610 family)